MDIPLGTDPSRSGRSTTLEMRGGRIFVEDSVSKRGTYVKIDDSVTVEDGLPKYFFVKEPLNPHEALLNEVT